MFVKVRLGLRVTFLNLQVCDENNLFKNVNEIFGRILLEIFYKFFTLLDT